MQALQNYKKTLKGEEKDVGIKAHQLFLLDINGKNISEIERCGHKIKFLSGKIQGLDYAIYLIRNELDQI